MATEWVTLSAASARLGLSQRTLFRRIASGAIESRVEQGRRLVAINLSARPGFDIPDDPDSPAASTSDNIPTLYSPLFNIWQRDRRAARRSAYLAWGVVAVVVLAAGVGLWWGTRTVERLRAELTVSRGTVADLVTRCNQVRDRADLTAAQLDEARQDVLQATTRAVGAETRLSASEDALVVAQDCLRAVRSASTRPSSEIPKMRGSKSFRVPAATQPTTDAAGGLLDESVDDTADPAETPPDSQPAAPKSGQYMDKDNESVDGETP